MDLSESPEPQRAADDEVISRLWASDVAASLHAMTPEQAAGRVGREFGFDAPVSVELWHSIPAMLVLGWLLAVAATLVLVAVSLDPNAGSGKPAILGCLAAAILAGVIMIGGGTRRRVLRGWLACYQDGYAQLLATDPGPRVVRWASVAEVTVTFSTVAFYTGPSGTATSTHVGGFSARPFIGRLAPEVGQRWASWRLMMNAVRVVGPRLVPALIGAYESGRGASFGSVHVDQDGVTVHGPGAPLRWPDIRSVRMGHVALARAGFVVSEVHLSRRGEPSQKIEVSGLPNGLFLPDVIAHAAAQHGVPVRGRLSGSERPSHPRRPGS